MSGKEKHLVRNGFYTAKGVYLACLLGFQIFLLIRAQAVISKKQRSFFQCCKYAAGKSVGKILSGCYTKAAAVENGSKFSIDRDTGIISVRAGYPCCFSAKTAFSSDLR